MDQVDLDLDRSLGSRRQPNGCKSGFLAAFLCRLGLLRRLESHLYKFFRCLRQPQGLVFNTTFHAGLSILGRKLPVERLNTSNSLQIHPTSLHQISIAPARVVAAGIAIGAIDY